MDEEQFDLAFSFHMVCEVLTLFFENYEYLCMIIIFLYGSLN